jgi:hypothetical protein
MTGNTVLIGCTYAAFQYYQRARTADIAAFIFCKPSLQHETAFLYSRKAPLPIYPLHELEARFKGIKRCQIFAEGLSMPRLQSLLHRILALRSVEVEFVSPPALKMKSFKPVAVFSALAPGEGKSQVARFICTQLRQARRTVSVIVSLSSLRWWASEGRLGPLQPIGHFPHFELSPGDSLLDEAAIPSATRAIAGLYQALNANRVYVTANVHRALIQAEQQADVILLDASKCENPQVESSDKFCIVDANAVRRPTALSRWPGLVNLMEATQIVVMVPIGRSECDPAIKEMFPTQPIVCQDMVSNSDGLVRFQDTDTGPPDVTLGRTTSMGVVPEMADDAPRPRPGVHIRSTDGRSDRHGMHRPQRCYMARDDQDVSGRLREWVSRYFREHGRAALREHFEAQVDIMRAMASASDSELYVQNNDSANMEAFCRLFLGSHLPPGYRVTNGEIIDSARNTSGQLDVVIVNDYCPRMTIDVTHSVIAPIVADYVLGVVEVKTSLTVETLDKALTQMRPVKALMPAHSTLTRADGEVIDDPLGGKIVTGVFAFKLGRAAEDQIPTILTRYPGVVDFVVVPGATAWFAASTLRVCGIEAPETAGTGFVQFPEKGMGLAFIFGILNVLAAERRFIGSNCVRYLDGPWGAGDSVVEEAGGDSVEDLKRKLSVVNSQLKSKAQAKRQLLDIRDKLKEAIAATRAKKSKRAKKS